MTESTTGRKRFIDVWRAIALLLVIVAHLSANIHVGTLLKTWGIEFIATYGQLGVFIFFFISGYVVSHSCFTELRRTGNFSLKAFYLRRCFRIIPPLMVYLSACLVLGLFGWIDFGMENWLAAALYVSNSKQNLLQAGWYAGHTWSLSFEEQFYLLFPTAFAFIELKRRPHRGVIVPLLLALVPMLFPLSWIGTTGFVVIYSLFIAGYCCAKHDSYLKAKFSTNTWLWFSVACVCSFLPVLSWDQLVLQKYYKCIYIITIPLMVISSGLLVGRVSIVFNNASMAYVGRVSYGIYLWQQLATAPDFHQSSLVIQFCLILLVVAFAMLSFHFFESPLIAIGKRISRVANRDSSALVTV